MKTTHASRSARLSPAMNRRSFIRKSALAGAAAAFSARSYAQIAGANERVRVGVIGFGLIGRIHTRSFHGLKESKVVAVSDCYRPRMDACVELVGADCAKVPDFRKILERNDVDAVVVAPGDHWHALQTMLACDAGKDWDMLLGPAPQRRYNPNRALYHFRWFWDYSGGQMTNLGHHSLDIVHWIFDLGAAKAASSSGGRHFLKDNGEVPDTQDAIIEYPKFTRTSRRTNKSHCSASSAASGSARSWTREITLRSSKNRTR